MLKASTASRSQSRVAPFTRSTLPVRPAVLTRSTPENNGVVATAPSTGYVGPLTWTKDNESIRDVFAFSGPLPERLNGRLAMWAFASFAAEELATHTPALEQASNGWFGAIFLSLALTVASLAPKLLSGNSLKDLQDSATSANMSGPGWQQILGAFDQNVELWTGRVAMIGVVGLIAAEVVKGDSFF